jgi:hypothetical protein
MPEGAFLFPISQSRGVNVITNHEMGKSYMEINSTKCTLTGIDLLNKFPKCNL